MSRCVSVLNQVLAIALLSAMVFVSGCGEDSGGLFNPLVDSILGGVIIIGGSAVAVAAAGDGEETEEVPYVVKETPMVLIPAGEFEMGDAFNEGSNAELPVHTVYLDAFYMDIYEVTNAQYARFLNEYGKNSDAAGHGLLSIDGGWIEKVESIYSPASGYEDHPVVGVTWYGAAAYAQFYGKRLPTEAEWEEAARGGLAGKRYPLGDEITHNDANYDGTGGKDVWDWGTDPVGSFAPNGYGVYDVAGNVWEWCADEYDSVYYGVSPTNNPKGPGTAIMFANNDFTNVKTIRVLRGGSWYNDTYFLRVSLRHYYEPSDSNFNCGFRCVSQYSSWVHLWRAINSTPESVSQTSCGACVEESRQRSCVGLSDPAEDKTASCRLVGNERWHEAHNACRGGFNLS